MAFVKKTWKDRIVQYANRRLLTKSGGSVEQVTVTRDEGTIYEAGDQFNASNMNDLEQRIFDVFDYDETASGSIIHITDGADNIPLKACNITIEPIQSGSGTPSPSNPRAISGFDSGVVSVCGVNLCDEVFETGDISFATGGNITGASWIRTPNYVPIVGGLTIYVKSVQNINMFFYDCNKTYLGNNSEGLRANIKNTVITISNNACYFRIATNQTPYNHDISINYPSTDTQYHSYNGNTYNISFGQTVYFASGNAISGEYDNLCDIVTDLSQLVWYYNSTFKAFYANLPVNARNQLAVDLSWCEIYYPTDKPLTTQTWSQLDDHTYLMAANFIATGRCAIVIKDLSYTDTTTFANSLIGKKFVYPLATPTSLSVSGINPKTISGENNIFSNCGDIEVTYYTDNADDILNFIHGEIGNLLPSIKYEEIDVTLDSTGEGTLFNSVKFVVGIKDIPSDSLYVGYASYIVASRTMIKAFSRSALAFTSQNIVSMTRKIGVYYLDNIATQ